MVNYFVEFSCYWKQWFWIYHDNEVGIWWGHKQFRIYTYLTYLARWAIRGGLWQGERGKDRFCNCKVQLMVLKCFLLNTFEFDSNIEWNYKQQLVYMIGYNFICGLVYIPSFKLKYVCLLMRASMKPSSSSVLKYKLYLNYDTESYIKFSFIHILDLSQM